MNLALSIVAVLGIVGLTASNVFLIFVIYRIKFLERARDLEDFKTNILEEKNEEPPEPTITEVSVYD